MVWKSVRPNNEQEDEGLKILQKFCRKKYSHSLANAVKSVRANELMPVTQKVRNVKSNWSSTNNPTDAIGYNECSVACAGSDRPNVYDVIEEILNNRIKPSHRNPIKLLWYKIELKFGRWIKYMLLLLMLIAYALLGGFLVQRFEEPAEREFNAQLDRKSMERHRIYVEKISNLLISPHCQSTQSGKNKSQIKCNRTIELVLEEYDELVGIHAYKQKLWNWTDYWNAVFYCGTIFTTIGYGNMWCRTTEGRVFTILYALLGVPFVLLVLNEFGKLILMHVRSIWLIVRKTSKCFVKFILRWRAREYQVSNEAQTDVDQSYKEVNSNCSNDNDQDETDKEDDTYETFPIYGAVLIIVVYIAICSFIFRIWENWDYFTAFYFFFISLTTVGLGDEMPNHPHYACVFFIFFIVGLALVSMCVSIVQMEFEMRFMKAIQLIDEYGRERQRRDQDSSLQNKGGPVRPVHSVPVLNPFAFVPVSANGSLKKPYRRTSSVDSQNNLKRVPSVLETVLYRTTLQLSDRKKKETLTEQL